MKPDISAPTHTPAETQWVEAELVRSLLRTARSTQAAGALLVLVYVGVLWGDTDPLALALWAAVAIVSVVLRWLVVRRYTRHVMTAGAARHLAFFARARHAWTLSAFVWGSTVWLYFDRSPLATQFICWLILAGIAMFALNGLASHLPTLRAYINIVGLLALGIVGWRAVVDLRLEGPYYHYWLMALLVIFWQVLHQTGRRMHMTHRRNFELQYRNTQLINSLTRQTQAALDAVAIKNRFLASATHDIRQPVHALGLYADWLASEPELVKELAPKIVESTKAVNTLFDSLFDLVRLDSGQIRLNLDEVRLDKLLADLELQYRPLAVAKGLELRVRPGRGSVFSDELLLKRIVGNLLSNAIKYTEDGGVLLAVRHGGGADARIEVWDTGVGIAPVHQRDIFREFYKVPIHEGTEDGFGLGLYIVSRLSHILGHPVQMASRQGRGTVFRLVLKASDPAEAVARAAALDQLARRP
jgi:signal transduction histidine kinase